MDSPFNTEAEEQKLRSIREREEEDLARILSEKYGARYIDLTALSINMDALRLLPEERAHKAEAVLFDKNGKHLLLAIHNPENQEAQALEREYKEQGYTLELYLVSNKSLARAYERYVDLSNATASEAGVFSIPAA